MSTIPVTPETKISAGKTGGDTCLYRLNEVRVAIPKEVIIACRSVDNKDMLGAGRLFCFIRAHKDSIFTFDEGFRKFLLKYFSRYEIKKHLDWLIKNGWIGVDTFGRHYLRGQRFFVENFHPKNNEFFSVCHVHSADILSKRAWVMFVDSVVAAKAVTASKQYQRRLKLKEMKHSKRKPASPKAKKGSGRPASASSQYLRGVSCPLSCIAAQVPGKMNKSTASRILKSACEGGKIKKKAKYGTFNMALAFPKHPKAITKPISASTFENVKRIVKAVAGKKAAGRMTQVNGVPKVQMANTVWANGVKFTSRKWPFFKPETCK